MWLFHPQRLCILAGICIFIIVVLTEQAESYGIALKSPKRDKKPSINSKSKSRKKSQKKSKKKSPKQKQKNNKKKNPPSKTEVNTCPPGAAEVQMNCLSCATKVYRTCPVAAATKVTKVYVVSEFDDSYDSCVPGRKKNYGIIGDNAIWVDKGCRARFKICYEKAKPPRGHEPKNVNCMCTSSRHNCPVGIPSINIHIQVSVLWSFGSGKCKEGQTWGYDDHDIWVDNGCSATFRVLW